jgi:uncharacterized membrane-anchored protein
VTGLATKAAVGTAVAALISSALLLLALVFVLLVRLVVVGPRDVRRRRMRRNHSVPFSALDSPHSLVLQLSADHEKLSAL